MKRYKTRLILLVLLPQRVTERDDRIPLRPWREDLRISRANYRPTLSIPHSRRETLLAGRALDDAIPQMNGDEVLFGLCDRDLIGDGTHTWICPDYLRIRLNFMVSDE